MNQNPADSIIKEFFENLKIENQYYSVQLKQPVLLIGEKELYKAIKETLEKANGANNSSDTTKMMEQKPQFKQLSSFPQQKFLL